MERRKTRQVFVGDVPLGGDAPIVIQSMLNAPQGDIEANILQARELSAAGCQLIRLSVTNMEDIETVKALKEHIRVPIIADIQMNYKLALASIEAGIDKIRINPRYIGGEDKIRLVADACKAHKVPIRVGVNSGSVELDLLEKYGGVTPEAMAESAMRGVKYLEDVDFHDIVISIKSSDIRTMIAAYRIVAAQCDYPLHLGVTEAGTERMGRVKSSIGIGALLVALFFLWLYLPGLGSPSPLTGPEWMFVGGWIILGIIFFIINKAGKNGKVPASEREYLMFGNDYRRF